MMKRASLTMAGMLLLAFGLASPVLPDIVLDPEGIVDQQTVLNVTEQKAMVGDFRARQAREPSASHSQGNQTGANTGPEEAESIRMNLLEPSALGLLGIGLLLLLVGLRWRAKA